MSSKKRKPSQKKCKICQARLIKERGILTCRCCGWKEKKEVLEKNERKKRKQKGSIVQAMREVR